LRVEARQQYYLIFKVIKARFVQLQCVRLWSKVLPGLTKGVKKQDNTKFCAEPLLVVFANAQIRAYLYQDERAGV